MDIMDVSFAATSNLPHNSNEFFIISILKLLLSKVKIEKFMIPYSH